MVELPQSVTTESGDSPGKQEKLLGFFLRRLEEWERMKHSGAGSSDPIAAKLLDRSIFSAWLDCVDLGGKEKAEEIIKRYAPGSEPRELSGSSSSK